MSGIFLRAYSPLGYYPTNALRDKDASLIIDEDLIYSVVRYKPVVIQNGYYHTDSEWLKPEEIRLLSAIALSVPEDCGKVYFYPDKAYKVDDAEYDLSDKEILNDLKKHLLSEMTDKDYYDPRNFLIRRQYAAPEYPASTESEELEDFEDTSQEPDLWFVSNPPPPAILGGAKYRIHDLILEVSRQKEIFDAIDIEDHLLIRGLGAFLKGDVLRAHSIFHTESCISLHIAMEATLQLILRRLKETIPNPSNKDASKFLGEAFNSNYPERYFEDFYEDRIKAIHPASRFGIFPDAPLEADDFYDLYDPLRAVYDYLISGHVRTE